MREELRALLKEDKELKETLKKAAKGMSKNIGGIDLETGKINLKSEAKENQERDTSLHAALSR